MSRGDGLCACGLAVCVCLGLTAEVIEPVHPHHDDRPSVVTTVQISPRHADHTHEEEVVFAGVASRKPPRRNARGLFWSGNDLAPFWSGNDGDPFWSPPESEGSGTHYSVA